MLARSARLSETLRRPLMISGGLFGLMLALRAWIQWVGPLPGDRYALAHYSPAHPGLPAGIIDVFVAIALPPVVIVLVLLGIWALWQRVGPRSAIGLGLASAVIVWNAVLKILFGPTPLWVQAHHAAVNYPSGHSSYVVGVFGYLAWICARRRQPALVVICAVIIIGMGCERVLSGVHLVSDVAGGDLLGLAWLIPVIAWVRSRPEPAPTPAQTV